MIAKIRKIFWKNDTKNNFRINNKVVENWFDTTQSLVFDDVAAQKEEKILKKIVKVNKNTKILDIGCGNGRYGKIFVPMISKYIGTDISNNFIKQNKLDFESNNAEFFHSPAHEFFYDDKFDYIFLIGLLTYMNDEEIISMTSNCSKMLKKDGELIIRNVVNKNSTRKFFDDKYFFIKHLFKSPRYQIIRRHEDEIASMISNDFKLLSTKKIEETSYKIYIWKLKNNE